MPALATLLVFAAATLAQLAVPGPSVLYVVARTAEQGRTAGLVSVLGLETGALIHVGAAAAGLSALVASSPTAFAALRYGGGAYLLWLGVRALCRTRHGLPVALIPASHARLFRDGVLVDLLNPKTALFFPRVPAGLRPRGARAGRAAGRRARPLLRRPRRPNRWGLRAAHRAAEPWRAGAAGRRAPARPGERGAYGVLGVLALAG